MPLRFTAADVDRAYDAWRLSCGPAAFAAILDLTLDEARPHFGPSFPGYTNPTLMFAALRSARRRYSVKHRTGAIELLWPQHGLCRVQWGGPWLQPGVPVTARYRHTHWVGAETIDGAVHIWDVNAFDTGLGPGAEFGWVLLDDWRTHLVPWLLEGVKRADGTWSITHSIEVERPAPGGR